jgi:hypothetical protein
MIIPKTNEKANKDWTLTPLSSKGASWVIEFWLKSLINTKNQKLTQLQIVLAVPGLIN